jgi:hypothetical protein
MYIKLLIQQDDRHKETTCMTMMLCEEWMTIKPLKTE